MATHDSSTGDTVVAYHIRYGAFGQIDSIRDASDSPVSALDAPLRFGFTGREWDAESGLYYYRARIYDAALGQFLSNDPIGFNAGDANLSRYVGNQSTIATDPSGNEIVINRTPPESATGILKSGSFRSQRGFAWFADQATRNAGMGKDKLAQSTATLIADIDVADAVRISNSQMKQFSAQAKSVLAECSPHLKAGTDEWAKTLSKMQHDLLHEHMASAKGNIFKLRVGGGYHYAVRESAQELITIVGVNGSDDAARLFAARVTGAAAARTAGTLANGIFRVLSSTAFGAVSTFFAIEGTAHAAEVGRFHGCGADDTLLRVRVRKSTEEWGTRMGLFSRPPVLIGSKVTEQDMILTRGQAEQLHGTAASETMPGPFDLWWQYYYEVEFIDFVR